MTRKPHPSFWPALCALGVLVVGCMWGVVRGEVLFAGDLHQTFEPYHSILDDSFRTGSLLWTSRVHNGAPVLANPIHQALYPPNLLFAWLDPGRAQSVLTLLHVLWSALGIALLARRLGRSRAAAVLAGAAGALNGAALSSTRLLSLAWTLAWLPWLLLAWLALRGGHRPGPLAAGLTTVTVVILLAGEPFVLLAGMLGLIAFTPWRPSRSHRRRLLIGSASLALAVTLALPWLLPVARWARTSVRAGGFHDEAVTLWSLHPLWTLGLLLPGLYGDPTATGLDYFWAPGLVSPQDDPIFPGLYLGPLVLALALTACSRRGSHQRSLLVWIVPLLLLALGRYGPAYPLLLHLPGAGVLRYPVKWLATAMVPAALLAAGGLDSLTAACRARSRALALPVAVGAALLLLVVAAGITAPLGLDRTLVSLVGPTLVPPERVVPLARDGLLGGSAHAALILGAAGLVLMWAVRTRRSQSLAWAWVSLAGIDLVLANRNLVATTEARFFTQLPEAVARLAAEPMPRGRVWVDPELPHGVTQVPRPRHAAEVYRWQRDTLGSYTALSYGLDLALTVDVEALTYRPYAQLQWLVTRAPARERAMVLGAAGVTHLVTFRPQESPAVELATALTAGSSRPLLLYRNRLSLPRARVVPRLELHDGLDGFVQAVSGAPDNLFHRTALVDKSLLGQTDCDLSAHADDDRAGTALVNLDRGHLLLIDTNGGGGWLVVSDTLAPGWRAEVDGCPTPLIPADLVFRCVRVPAGNHRVRMSYHPWRS